MLKKIISGGQIGTERAALDAAIKLNIPHGGWAYKGRKTEDGPLPEKYMVREISNKSFSGRIEKNVLEAAGTVIFTHGKLTIGLTLTKELTLKTSASVSTSISTKPLFIVRFRASGLGCLKMK